MIEEAKQLPGLWPAIDNLLVDDEHLLCVSTIVENFDICQWWILKASGELITKFEWPRDEPIDLIKKARCIRGRRMRRRGWSRWFDIM